MLCDLAEQESCAVIVVGCRRSGTASLGPTVDYVLRKASCPVILASGKQRRESFDLVAGLGQFQLMKPSPSKDPRFRRISCPARCNTPLGPEAGEDGGAVGGETEDKVESMLERKGGSGAKEGLMPPARQRRHSTVVNVFQQLTLQGSGRKKLIPKKPEENEETENTKC